MFSLLLEEELEDVQISDDEVGVQAGSEEKDEDDDDGVQVCSCSLEGDEEEEEGSGVEEADDELDSMSSLTMLGALLSLLE